MKVRSFMVPADKVITCNPGDTLSVVTAKMMEHNVGSIVVMPTEGVPYPLGIVTKTDLLRGWQQCLDLDSAKAEEVMGTKIETVLDTAPKDAAATHFEKTKHRHAFVVNAAKEYVGLIGSLDIAVECAKDSRAWPYVNRDELAEKFTAKAPRSPTWWHKAPAPKPPTSPTAPHTFLDIAGAGINV